MVLINNRHTFERLVKSPLCLQYTQEGCVVGGWPEVIAELVGPGSNDVGCCRVDSVGDLGERMDSEHASEFLRREQASTWVVGIGNGYVTEARS